MNNLLQISILEAIYIIYMLRYFKTKYSFAHPLTYFNSDMFYHPIGISDVKESKICKFGHITSWYLAILLILRCILYNNKLINKEIFLSINRLIFFGVLSVSLLNLNAFIYLIPFFIIEYNYFLS